MTTNANGAINHPPLAPQSAPPQVMGIYYREYTLFPLHVKLGRNIVLFNKTSGCLAHVDARGCVRLEPGGDYLPERSDSDRLKKLLEDAKRASKQLSNSSNKWSSRISGSLSNLTIGRSSRRSPSAHTKTNGKYASSQLVNSNESVQQAPVFTSLETVRTQSTREQLPIPEDAAGDGGAISGGFFGTLRARRKSSDTLRSQYSYHDKRTAIINEARFPVSADLLPRGRSSCSIVESDMPVEDDTGNEDMAMDEFLRCTNQPPPPSPNVSIPIGIPGCANDSDILNHSTSMLISSSSAAGKSSSFHGHSISEEENPDLHGQSISVVDVVDVAMFGSLIILIDGRPGTLRGLVDSIAVADNCLAMPDIKPGGDPCLFHILQDDSSFTLLTKTREELLNWVSTINTATLAHLLTTIPILQANNNHCKPTESDPSSSGGDYRKEYEEIIKSFDLVELARIKLPSSNIQHIIPVQDPNLLANQSSSPISTRGNATISRPHSRNISDRLHQIRQDHRMSILRQTTVSDMNLIGSSIKSNTTPELHTLSISIPSAPIITSEISPSSSLGTVGDDWSTGVGSSLIPFVRSGSPVDAPSPTARVFRGDISHIDNSPPTNSTSPELPIIVEPQTRKQDEPPNPISTTPFGANGAGAPLLRQSEGNTFSSAFADLPATSTCTASLDKLIERLACDLAYDPNYVDTFLIGYRHITSACIVLDKLFARMYCMAPSGATVEEKTFVLTWRPIVRLRVIAVIKHWVERYWVDFILDLSAKEKLEEILWAMDNFEPESDEIGIVATEQRAYLARLSKLIKKLILFQKAKSVKPEQQQLLVDPGMNASPTKSMLDLSQLSSPAATSSPNKVTPPCEFLDLDPVQIAIQLTVLEFKRFKEIRPIDCALNLWADTKDPAVQMELNAITEMVNSFNRVSYWVATEICTQPELQNRAKVVERMIKIAKVCKQERNYNTLVSIIAGLNNSAVQRLKQTWEVVQDKYTQTFNDLEDLVSQNHNFKNYRQLLDIMEQENWRQPFIPFFGLFLKDLMFWNENAKHTDTGLINFSKLRSIASLIQELRKWQRHEYVPPLNTGDHSIPSSTPSSPTKSVSPQLKPCPPTTPPPTDLVVYYCSHLRALKEQHIYKYSCLCERKLNASSGGADSVRLIDKWASEKSPNVIKSNGKAR